MHGGYSYKGSGCGLLACLSCACAATLATGRDRTHKVMEFMEERPEAVMALGGLAFGVMVWFMICASRTYGRHRIWDTYECGEEMETTRDRDDAGLYNYRSSSMGWVSTLSRPFPENAISMYLRVRDAVPGAGGILSRRMTGVADNRSSWALGEIHQEDDRMVDDDSGNTEKL